MGRPPHPIWTQYEITIARTSAKPHPDVKCLHCLTVLKNGQPSRNMLQHTVQCHALPEEDKKRWRDIEEDQRIKQQKLEDAKTEAATSATTPEKRRRVSLPREVAQAPASPSSPSTRAAKRASVDGEWSANYVRVARGFRSAGLPLCVLENAEFRAMFDYLLPSRRELAQMVSELDDPEEV